MTAGHSYESALNNRIFEKSGDFEMDSESQNHKFESNQKRQKERSEDLSQIKPTGCQDGIDLIP